MKNEEMMGRVINVDVENLPKSYVLVRYNKNSETFVYISPIATQTLLKRANHSNLFDV